MTREVDRAVGALGRPHTPQRAAMAGKRRESAVDTAAFEAAVADHYDHLVRRLTMVVADRQSAEDLAQETCLRAYRSWETFDGTDVRAWLFTIGLRLAFNDRRRTRRWFAAIRRIEPKPMAAPSDPDLWAALARLDPKTRAALLLNAVDGYTQREIAAMLGVPEGTVSSWLTRGRAALRVELSDAGERLVR